MHKPLALKRQRATTATRKRTFSRIAEIIVDNGIFHLDEPFSYGIPEELSRSVQIGSYVKVRFRDQLTTGVVLSLGDSEQPMALSPVVAVLNSHGITEEMVRRCIALSQRYACSLHDLIRFATANLNGIQEPVLIAQDVKDRSGARIFHRAENQRSIDLLVNLAAEQSGRTLIICDTRRNATQVIALAQNKGLETLDLSDSRSKTDMKRSLSMARVLDRFLAVGQRSLLFAPVGRIDNVIILNEWSEHHWEQRSPYWNSRDVALVAQENERFNLHFVGSAFSMELARLIEKGYIITKKKLLPTMRNRTKFTMLPESYHRTIREGLKNGHVLVSVASKSYVNSLICSYCRNRALCECGSTVSQTKSGEYRCALCSRSYSELSCRICLRTSFLSLGKGGERIAVELGKAFPGRPIMNVTSESNHENDLREHTIVISTAGVEPVVPNGYSAVVLLDGEFLASQPFLRGEEFLFQRWALSLELANPKAAIYLSLLPANGLAQTLTSSRSEIFVNRTLRMRREMNFPPYSRFIQIAGDNASLNALSSALKEDFSKSCTFYPISKDNTLTIAVSLEAAPDVLKALRSLQRYRSVSKRKLLDIRVDQYLL